MPRPRLILLACSATLLAGGCATPPDSNRPRIVAPNELVALHSDIGVQAQLLLTPEATCEGDQCSPLGGFPDQVARLARRLIPAGRRVAMDAGQADVVFEVSVPGKAEVGTVSSASGKIIVFDGLERLGLSDPALAFLIAREMGHIIARHHAENSTTSLGVSLALALVFPLAGILHGAETAYTASSLAGSLTSTAASFAGSRILQGFYRDDQRREADLLALRILVDAGWSAQEVDAACHVVAPLIVGDGWMDELRASMHWLDQLTMGPPHVAQEDEPVAPPTVDLAPVVVPAALPLVVAATESASRWAAPREIRRSYGPARPSAQLALRAGPLRSKAVPKGKPAPAAKNLATAGRQAPRPNVRKPVKPKAVANVQHVTRSGSATRR